MNNKSIGVTIRKLRMQSNIKQVAFAKEIGVTQTMISLIETNKARASIATIEKIATALNVTPEKIIELTICTKRKKDTIDFIFKYFK